MESIFSFAKETVALDNVSRVNGFISDARVKEKLLEEELKRINEKGRKPRHSRVRYLLREFMEEREKIVAASATLSNIVNSVEGKVKVIKEVKFRDRPMQDKIDEVNVICAKIREYRSNNTEQRVNVRGKTVFHPTRKFSAATLINMQRARNKLMTEVNSEKRKNFADRGTTSGPLIEPKLYKIPDIRSLSGKKVKFFDELDEVKAVKKGWATSTNPEEDRIQRDIDKEKARVTLGKTRRAKAAEDKSLNEGRTNAPQHDREKKRRGGFKFQATHGNVTYTKKKK